MGHRRKERGGGEEKEKENRHKREGLVRMKEKVMSKL